MKKNTRNIEEAIDKTRVHYRIKHFLLGCAIYVILGCTFLWIYALEDGEAADEIYSLYVWTGVILFLVRIGSAAIRIARTRRCHSFSEKERNVIMISPRRLRVKNRKGIFIICICILLAGTGAAGRAYERSKIPESLIELEDRNPETRSFVNGYSKNAGRHIRIDLDREVKKGTIPSFLQWDERWGYTTYGSDYLAITGCGPTSLSMVYCGLTGDTYWNPARVADFSEKNGYYEDGVGTSWSLMTEGAGKLGLVSLQGTVSSEYILDHLTETTPMIVSMKPGIFTSQGHFMLLTKVNTDGTISIHDPNSRKNTEKEWDVDTLVSQMKAVWVLRKK